MVNLGDGGHGLGAWGGSRSCRPSRNPLTLPSRNSLARREADVYSMAPPSRRARGCSSARSSPESTVALKSEVPADDDAVAPASKRHHPAAAGPAVVVVLLVDLDTDLVAAGAAGA